MGAYFGSQLLLLLLLLLAGVAARDCPSVLAPTADQTSNAVTLTFARLTVDDWAANVETVFRRQMASILSGSPNSTVLNECSVVPLCAFNELTPQNFTETGNVAVSFFLVTSDGIYPGSLLLVYVRQAVANTALETRVWPLARPPTAATSSACVQPGPAAATAQRKTTNWAVNGTIIGAGALVALIAVAIVIMVYTCHRRAAAKGTQEIPPLGGTHFSLSKYDTIIRARGTEFTDRRTLDLSGLGRDIDVDRDSLAGQSQQGPQTTPPRDGHHSREASYILSPSMQGPASPLYATYAASPASTDYGVYDVPHFTTPATGLPGALAHDYRATSTPVTFGSPVSSAAVRRVQAFEAFSPQLSPRMHDPGEPHELESADQSTQL